MYCYFSCYSVYGFVFVIATRMMSLHQKLPAVIRVELTSTVRDTVLQIVRGEESECTSLASE